MAKSDTVYLVTQGEYSDYHVTSVFLDEAQANEHVEQWNALTGQYNDRSVQVYSVTKKVPKLAVLYTASWTDIQEHLHAGEQNVQMYQRVVEVADEHLALDQLIVSNYRYFSCESFDSRRAVKIVGDARAKRLAQKAGL